MHNEAHSIIPTTSQQPILSRHTSPLASPAPFIGRRVSHLKRIRTSALSVSAVPQRPAIILGVATAANSVLDSIGAPIGCNALSGGLIPQRVLSHVLLHFRTSCMFPAVSENGSISLPFGVALLRLFGTGSTIRFEECLLLRFPLFVPIVSLPAG